MPPIRADHGLSWRKSGAGGEEERERSKQPRRTPPAVTKRSSPSHSRTPSPNLQAPASSAIATVHSTAAYGHVAARRKAGSPSSKAFENGIGSRSGSTSRSHAHPQQRPPFKVAAAGTSSWGISSPKPGVGNGAGGSGRAGSPPTRSSGVSGSGSARAHSSPTLASRDAAAAPGAIDGLQLPPESATAAAAAAAATATAVAATAGAGMTLSSSSSAASAATLMPTAAPSGGSGGTGSLSLLSDESKAEAREMTLLDRVFLEQPHEGRQDVEGDDLHVSNEIQRHLKNRVQSQQSQLMEAMESSVSASAIQQHQHQHQPVLMSNVPAVLCSSSGGGGGGGGGGRSDFTHHHHHGPPDILVPCSGVTPVSPSSGSGPVPGRDDLDAMPELPCGPMDYLLSGPSSGGGVRGGNSSAASNRDIPSPARRARSRSPPVPPALGSGADIQMGEAAAVGGGGGGGGSGGDGHLREVVSGLDAMDLDNLENVESALALLNAKKQQIIAKKQQQQQQHQQAHQYEYQHPVTAVPPPPPPQSSHGGSSRTVGVGSRQRRSGSRYGSKYRLGGESSPSTVGGRSEGFGVSAGGSARGGGGGGGGASIPVSYSSGRGARGQQGRPPPVPGHLSASTAAMRRSSPGNFASLAELDSYLEHHHRRLVEQVEGGVVADDVEAEIRASRNPRRGGTRSHHRFGAGPGSHNGFGSSSSGGSVPRTVGAGLCTEQFFDSTVSADGYCGAGSSSSRYHNHNHYRFGHHSGQYNRQNHQHQQRVAVEWVGDGESRSGSGNGIGNGTGNGISERSPSSASRGWDFSASSKPRGQGYKRERPELHGDGVGDGAWGASLRGFRGESANGGRYRDGDEDADVDVDVDVDGGDADSKSSAFMGVSGTTSVTSSPPPSIMSSDDVSVSSFGHPVTVTVLPGSPNKMRFDGRPPSSLNKIRLEAVRHGGRSAASAVRGGRGGLEHGRGGGGGGPMFTSPDASKHVHELCSPRSAFTPRSASSVSSLASSRGRR